MAESFVVSSLKQVLRRMLRTPEDVDVRSQLKYFFWQRILRINGNAPWTVHFTSRIVAPEKVKLGRGSYPGDMPGCYIQAINGIVIGDYCLFGPNCGLISANHDPNDPRAHISADPIRIGSHSWVGFGAVILPGVQLGPNTTVGANAVVTKSFPNGHCILAGNPAIVVKSLTPSSDAASIPALHGQIESGGTNTTPQHSASEA